jgi:hypothetical protein
MKKLLSIIGIVTIAGGLIGISIPIVQAQTETPGSIVFHVLPNHIDGSNLQVIPADAPDQIIIMGTLVKSNVGIGPTGSELVRARIKNDCGDTTPGAGTPTPTPTPTPAATPTGTPSPSACQTSDLYYSISLTITWENTYYVYPTGVCCNYSDKNLATWNIYKIGGSENITSSPETERCGAPYQKSGSCSREKTGTISAGDIQDTGIGDYVWDEEIRIDVAADYPADVLTMNYVIILSTTPIRSDCAGQYNIGSILGTVVVNGNDSVGVDLKAALGPNYPEPGQWYVIHISSGYWQNNGAGPQLKELGLKVASGSVWLPLTANPSVGCRDVGNDTFYVQMLTSDPYMLRVYDTDGNWANTGSLTVTISGVAAYNPYSSGCELQYKIGALIEQKTVVANFNNGWPLEVTKSGWLPFAVGGGGIPKPQRYYMLETIGGPAHLGTGVNDILTWDADMALREDEEDKIPSSWYEIQSAPFIKCVSRTDIVGHVKVFFAMDEQTALYEFTKFYYAFRVRDTGTYADNYGSLGYRLYEATFQQTTLPGEVPDPNGCVAFAHDATLTGSVVVSGNNADGVALPTMTPPNMYNLEVTGGPWTDNGTDKYSIEISDDGGTTWKDLEDYTNLLCAASADGLHTEIYFYHAAGKSWKVRVNDGDANYGNNALSVTVNIYPGHGYSFFPTCQNDYTSTKIPMGEDARKIPGNDSVGKELLNIQSGKVYEVEITGDAKWYEAGAGAGSYDVDISDDGGLTWGDLEKYPHLVCVQTIGNNDRYIMFFTAQGSSYKLRVRDGDGNFLTNTGGVYFNLYSSFQSANPPPGPSIITAPPEWVVACNERYQRPNSFFAIQPIFTTNTIIGPLSLNLPIPRVGEWIDYLRSAIVYYFAWCPQHTDALASAGTAYMDKEPWATINDLIGLVKSVQSSLIAYQGTGGTSEVDSQEPALFNDTAFIGTPAPGGGGFDGPISPPSTGPWDLFIQGNNDPSHNVLFGGTLDLGAAAHGSDLTVVMASYKSTCITRYTPLWGISTDSYCSILSVLRYEKIIAYVLFAVDVILVLWFVAKYLPNWVKRLWALITGNKSAVGKVINNL